MGREIAGLDAQHVAAAVGQHILLRGLGFKVLGFKVEGFRVLGRRVKGCIVLKRDSSYLA